VTAPQTFSARSRSVGGTLSPTHKSDVPPELSSRVRLLEHGRIDKTDPNDVAACDVEARRVCRIMEQFRVESSMSELGAVRLSVRGELEATTADTLVDELCQWLGIRECVVDLGGCDFVDSAGIRALIECRHQIGPDAPMRLVGLSPQVERTLRRVGLDQLLTFQPASTDASSSPETNGTADVPYNRQP